MPRVPPPTCPGPPGACICMEVVVIKAGASSCCSSSCSSSWNGSQDSQRPWRCSAPLRQRWGPCSCFLLGPRAMVLSGCCLLHPLLGSALSPPVPPASTLAELLASVSDASVKGAVTFSRC